MHVEGPLDKGAKSGDTIFGHWVCNPPNGYPRFSSGPYRGRYVHRVIWEVVAGTPILDGFVIHHMDNNRTNFHPSNLVCLPECLHRHETVRCPYTGRYIGREEYFRMV